MLYIIIPLAIGLGLGHRIVDVDSPWLARANRLTLGGLFVLLFFMGASLGIEAQTELALGQLGWQALILAAGTVVASTCGLWLLAKKMGSLTP